MENNNTTLIYDLIKLNTLDDAKHPQPDKYPNGTTKTGYLWNFNMPEIGKEFYVHTSKLQTCFKTSTIVEIIENTQEHIIFKTINSTYIIKFK